MPMRFPSDQAKLLLLSLLRSASAFASTEKILSNSAAWRWGPLAAATQSSSSSSSSSSLYSNDDSQQQQQQHQIVLRLATRTDVSSIQRCNLATLPENYNQYFYANHLRQWPELILVAERLPDYSHQPAQVRNSFAHLARTNPDPQIVAYVIGKVEETHTSTSTTTTTTTNGSSTSWALTSSASASASCSSAHGHVTSLAVLEDFRRLGLAHALMEQLHWHMAQCYGVTSVGLHVRRSNRPATKLYQRFGYAAEEAIPGYYQDGEDAYFMKKAIRPQVDKQQQQTPTTTTTTSTSTTSRQYQVMWQNIKTTSSSLLGNNNNNNILGNNNALKAGVRAKPWEDPTSALRLPRIVVDTTTSASSEEDNDTTKPDDSQQQSTTTTTTTTASSSSNSELLTGTA